MLPFLHSTGSRIVEIRIMPYPPSFSRIAARIIMLLGIIILELTRLSGEATDLSGDELAVPCLSTENCLAALTFCI